MFDFASEGDFEVIQAELTWVADVLNAGDGHDGAAESYHGASGQVPSRRRAAAGEGAEHPLAPRGLSAGRGSVRLLPSPRESDPVDAAGHDGCREQSGYEL